LADAAPLGAGSAEGDAGNDNEIVWLSNGFMPMMDEPKPNALRP
jgi:hypothetical protein